MYDECRNGHHCKTYARLTKFVAQCSDTILLQLHSHQQNVRLGLNEKAQYKRYNEYKTMLTTTALFVASIVNSSKQWPANVNDFEEKMQNELPLTTKVKGNRTAAQIRSGHWSCANALAILHNIVYNFQQLTKPK